MRAVGNSSVLIALSTMNVPVLGTVGLLIWAKRVGTIASLREQLDRLRMVGRFRVRQPVYDEALRVVGEV